MRQQIHRNILTTNWFFLAPIILLILLFLYLVLPDKIQKNDNTSNENPMATEKAALESKLQTLIELKEEAVCKGDQLVIPKNQESTLLPPLEPKTLLEKLEQGVVFVLAGFDGKDELALGTGFFISPSLIMTNAHVLFDGHQSAKSILIANRSFGVKPVSLYNSKFNESTSEDFALLSLEESIGSPLALAKMENPEKFKLTPVYAAGFPGIVIESDKKFIDLMGGDGSSIPDMVITNGTISSSQKYLETISAFIHSAQISPGNSGGPLVNECGQVLGINTFNVHDEDDSRNFSITSSEILKYLKELNLDPNVAAGECK